MDTVNNFSYAHLINGVPVATTYRSLFGDLYGFNVYNGNMRRVLWSELESAGSVDFITKSLRCRSQILPTGASSNFVYQVGTPRGEIATGSVNY
jgi:hypothetical protein